MRIIKDLNEKITSNWRALAVAVQERDLDAVRKMYFSLDYYINGKYQKKLEQEFLRDGGETRLVIDDEEIGV